MNNEDLSTFREKKKYVLDFKCIEKMKHAMYITLTPLTDAQKYFDFF